MRLRKRQDAVCRVKKRGKDGSRRRRTRHLQSKQLRTFQLPPGALRGIGSLLMDLLVFVLFFFYSLCSRHPGFLACLPPSCALAVSFPRSLPLTVSSAVSFKLSFRFRLLKDGSLLAQSPISCPLFVWLTHPHLYWVLPPSNAMSLFHSSMSHFMRDSGTPVSVPSFLTRQKCLMNNSLHERRTVSPPLPSLKAVECGHQTSEQLRETELRVEVLGVVRRKQRTSSFPVGNRPQILGPPITAQEGKTGGPAGDCIPASIYHLLSYWFNWFL